MIWTIISLIFLLVFVILCILLINKIKTLKMKISEEASPYNYIANTFITEQTLAGNTNRVYVNNLDSKQFIDKYIISYENGRPFLICNFIKSLKDMHRIEICTYSIKHELLSVIYIKKPSTFQQSPIIKLPKNINAINIHVKEQPQEEDKRKPWLNIRDYKNIGKLESIAMGLLLAPLSYLLLHILAGEIVNEYMNLGTLILGLVFISITCVANYILIHKWILIKRSYWGDIND